MKLTAIILNHLPLKSLRPTLASLKFADEIIVIQDSIKIKPPAGIKIYFRNLNGNFAHQRNFALTKAKHNWILFIDSDEIVSKTLADEIKQAINSTDFQGYFLPRQDIILEQILKHGETNSVRLLRLAQKNSGKFSRNVHEKWNIKGRVGQLKSAIEHHKHNLTSEFIKKISSYGIIDYQSLNKENKPFSYFKLLFYPPLKFIQNYILRRGFLDGYLGLFHAYLMSLQSLSVRIFQKTC